MKTCRQISLSIAIEFSRTPGPRLASEGEFSGEQFRNDCLGPAFKRAIDEGAMLMVDLDGTAGYGTSFLEEAFGGLIRDLGFTLEKVKAHLHIKSTDEPEWCDEIESYLAKAETERTKQ